MRISSVGYSVGYINTAMNIGNAARSVMNHASPGNRDVLSPIDKVPRVYSNAETKRIVKTPEEMSQDRLTAWEVLTGKTQRNAEHLNPYLEEIVEEIEKEQLGQEEGDLGEKVSSAEGVEECETCKNRKYVDGSDEGNVSFQSPQHIAPSNAAGAVLAHEFEHVRNARREDQREDAKLLSVSVSLKTAVCPECGKIYVAGGETRTTMSYTMGEEKDQSFS